MRHGSGRLRFAREQTDQLFGGDARDAQPLVAHRLARGERDGALCNAQTLGEEFLERCVCLAVDGRRCEGDLEP